MKTKTKKSVSTLKPTKTPNSVALSSIFSFKHEQALLVALAYLIGFTTAFIAFRLSDDTRFYDNLNASLNVSTMHEGFPEISLINGDLLVNKDGVDRIVSAKSMSLEVEDGFHREVITASISPNGRFLHYCVIVSDGTDSCANFVYSIEDNIVHRVKNSGGQVKSDETSLRENNWSDDGRLNLNNSQSTSPEQPWQIAN